MTPYPRWARGEQNGVKEMQQNIFNEKGTKIVKKSIQAFVTNLNLPTEGVSYLAEIDQETKLIHFKLFYMPQHKKEEMSHIGSAMIGAMASQLEPIERDLINRQRKAAGLEKQPSMPKVSEDGMLDLTFVSENEMICCINALTSSPLLKLDPHQHLLAQKSQSQPASIG